MKKNYPNLKNLAPLFFLLFTFTTFSQTTVTINAGTTSWTVPAGVGGSITVEVWGAGGSGGGCIISSNKGGSGGTGGTYVRSIISGVVAGTVYNLSVAGPTTGTPGANGTNGGSSWFNTIGTLFANGGLGGIVGDGAARTAVSTGSIGSTITAGGSTLAGSSAGGSAGGNGGNVANGGGAGGSAIKAGNNSQVNGNPGFIAGGGGSGASTGGGTGGSAVAGGAGAAGQIKITYTYSPTIISLGSIEGCAGGSITINGTYLTGATAANVKIGGTPVTSITSNNGTAIVAVIGSGTTGMVSVTTLGGTATSAATFIVYSGAPSQPGTITGSPTQCAALGGQVYSLAPVTNTSTYTWNVPVGWSITSGQGTTSIVVKAGNAGQNGNITVTLSNSCVIGATSTLATTVNTVPTITKTTFATRCEYGTLLLGATASAGVVNWYTAATGGTLVHTGDTYQTPNLTTTATYWVDATANGCTTQTRSPIIAEIVPPIGLSTSGGGIHCSGGTLNLISSGANVVSRSWTGPNGFTSTLANPTIVNLTSANSGTYAITAKTKGINLVINGDFEAGNINFLSSYGYVAPSPTALQPEGFYTVVANPNTVHSSFSSCEDHTVAPGTLQMVVNGAVTANVNVWEQTVNVIPYTDYEYSYWVQSVHPTNPAKLQLFVNNDGSGTTVNTASASTCVWSKFSTIWNSGASTVAKLELRNQNIIASGNDFSLDDFEFRSICTSTESIIVNVTSDPPITPGTITGETMQCSSSTGEIYSITNVLNASTYTWTVPTGWAITSGQGTTSITVNPTSPGESGLVSVTAGNPCGTSSANTLAVTVKPSSIDFDGDNDYVDFGDNHDFTTNFSLEAWVLQEATTTTGIGAIISKGDAKLGAGNQRGYHLVLNNGKANLTWFNNIGDVSLNLESTNAILNNKWHHIAAVYNGTEAILYVDGIEVNRGTPSIPSLNGPENFLIGAMYDSSSPTNPKNKFNGYIDEVRVWGVALSELQIREMMNQEIVQNATAVKGKIIPLNISDGLLWANLKGYYPMTNDMATDESGNSVNGSANNICSSQLQTAPLPYTTKYEGSWTDRTVSTPWTYGDSVWDYPNSIGYNNTPIDWNIVQIAHNINSGAKDIAVLGLISSETGKLSMNGDNDAGTGQSLRVTHYLELDGVIDLEGESQLLQDEGSILDQDSGGYIERDQQGTANSYNYNYWSSSVGPISAVGTKSTRGTGNASINAPFTIKGIINDGSAIPLSIVYGTSPYAADAGPGAQLIISSYWLYQFYGKDDDYNSWFPRINEDYPLAPGVGYTMKGSSGKVSIAEQQNYVFRGKPNNGDITLELLKTKISPTGDVSRLIGNPYPSAMDADEFIKDNISEANGGKVGNTENIFNGALYFWDHFGEQNTHILREYVGGYATRNLTCGAPAISNDSRINHSGGPETINSIGKEPGQFIPVGQGFFVGTNTVTGGNIVFKNSQRAFQRESAVTGPSVFMKAGKPKSEFAQNKENITTRPIIRLMYDSPTGYHRQIVIGKVENTSNHFDLGYDAPIADINKEDMYWTFDGAKFVIQGVPNFDDNQEFPLGLNVSKTGLARIKIDGLENMDEDISLHIKDKLTGESHNISKKSFEIDLAPGTYLDRFVLTFKTQKLVTEDVIAEVLIPAASQPIIEGIHVFMNNGIGELQIKNNSIEEITSIVLYNYLGQTIKTWNSNFNIRTISLPISTATGVYLVQINTKTGKTVKKISVE